MRVETPSGLSQALAALQADPQATLLAGGTDLMVAINFGRERPEHLVCVGRLEELQALEVGEEVRCGAGVTYSRLLEELDGSTPALAQAARTVGSPQIRNAGTVGGNLGTCSPAGDTLPVLAALDAQVEIASSQGSRRLGLSEFMLGPKQSALQAGELVTGVSWRSCGPSQVFMKAGTRNAMVIAVASLALVVDRAARRVRVGLGSVGPTVLRAPEAESLAEALFEASGWDRPLRAHAAVLRGFAGLVASAALPIDDVRGTAAYRRHVVAVMAERALARAGALV
jgi:CO/xanthine dehydrogenase FAD-binding subunit